MRRVALTLRQPTLPLRQGAVPQRGGRGWIINLISLIIESHTGFHKRHRITSPINVVHAGAGIHRIAPVTRCAMRGDSNYIINGEHGATED